jgi:hypothetical protein
LLSSTTARGFTIPGTPDGVGEQQCFIDLEGNASVIEIIHFEKGRCATTRVMSPTPPVPTRTTFEVQPIKAGCIVILTFEVDLAVGRGLRPDSETEWRHGAADYLERLRRVLDDEAGSPSFAPDSDVARPLDKRLVATSARSQELPTGVSQRIGHRHGVIRRVAAG